MSVHVVQEIKINKRLIKINKNKISRDSGCEIINIHC